MIRVRTKRSGPTLTDGAASQISRRRAADCRDANGPEGCAWEQFALDFDAVPPPVDEILAGRDRAERNTDDWWRATAMQAVLAAAATRRVFQAFDLVETYGIAEPDHPNRWGALLTRAAREGVIVAVGAAPSRRPSTARSLTRTWQGREQRR